MLFLIDKYLRKELGLTGEVRIATLRSLAVKILKAISVVEHDNESLLRGVEDVQFKDIEDSCQYQAAYDTYLSLVMSNSNKVES